MPKLEKVIEPETLPTPTGKWGIFAEPRKDNRQMSQWLNFEPTNYELAFREADKMNRSNPAWFYYAKPISSDKFILNGEVIKI
ncbi:MAG: hypothetical protein ACFFG0_41210 [Candidatus Thorarchaeota archaeon]